ncbi:MAG: flagellar motor switch phosphatase FliY [Oscillospiraceae bacterium]|jgi:flagellar motor switch protein FliN/FliY|nr:flagellar motor switch phosphatase FliY [Oscillospiraceae bacterium]
MNLSQDEINALSEADQQGDDAASPVSGAAVEQTDVEIMSPDAIAAMLNETADGQPTLSDDENGDLNDLFSRLGEDGEREEAERPHAKSKDGLLTAEEVDVLGEVGNISMGAVATTMYSLLDRRVSITTPRVNVYESREVLSVYHIPFVVATIEYVDGISGSNLLVLKVEDAALITDLLMGGDGIVEAPVELSELHLSAMSEVMNQMMGASSTALSKLLHTPVDISPPVSIKVDAGFDVSEFLGNEELATKISFAMEIEGLLKSELIQLIPYEMSRGFAKRFIDIGMGVPSGEAAAQPAMKSAPTPPPKPAPAPEPPPVPTPAPPAPAPPPPLAPQSEDPQAMQYPQGTHPSAPYPYPPYPYPPAPYPQVGAAAGRLVDVHPLQFQSFDGPGPAGEQRGIDLVYNIPLQVTVELGKTKKEISEILEFSMGTIVVLDKIAGDPVEIVVNGKLIARGEVVVIDDSYGVRITDIING